LERQQGDTDLINKEFGDISFAQPGLLEALKNLGEEQFDALPFGVIGFGVDGLVTVYNRFEMNATGLTREYVVGKHVFSHIAQCMNNFLVAQRYEDARETGQDLDAVLDYVLTWRMKPTKVKLRLLCASGCATAYLVLSPRSAMNP
jgi:photoactive yellow protein